MDGVREYESPAHAPLFPYRLGIHGTVWRFRLRKLRLQPNKELKFISQQRLEPLQKTLQRLGGDPTQSEASNLGVLYNSLQQTYGFEMIKMNLYTSRQKKTEEYLMYTVEFTAVFIGF